jgi:hypothetical protein
MAVTTPARSRYERTSWVWDGISAGPPRPGRPTDPHRMEGALALHMGTSKIGVVFSNKSTEPRSIFPGERAHSLQATGVNSARISHAPLDGLAMSSLTDVCGGEIRARVTLTTRDVCSYLHTRGPGLLEPKGGVEHVGRLGCAAAAA